MNLEVERFAGVQTVGRVDPGGIVPKESGAALRARTRRAGGGLFFNRRRIGVFAALFGCAAAMAQKDSRSGENPPSAPGASGTTASKPANEIETWFATVDKPQQEMFRNQVLQPFDAGLAELRLRYLASLDAAIARASAAGQLEEALACRAERLAFEKTQQPGSDDATTPVPVKTLRATFRQQLAKLEQDRASRAGALFAAYDAALAKNQSLLTQRGRLDDALFLKARREEIAREWSGPGTINGSGKSAIGRLAATTGAPFVNTLGMKFVPVQGTNVLFSVWVTRVRDYAAYAQVNKVDDGWTKQQRGSETVSREPEFPVVGVSWEDAQAFCRWLTEKEGAAGKLPEGTRYRLPTDEEWSRAAGLPSEPGATPAEKNEKIKVYPWGVEFPPRKSNVGNFGDAAWHEKFPGSGWIEGYKDGYATTSPVGTFPANANGLFDMGGNVWQWCEDWLNKDQKERVFRGGSYSNFGNANLLLSHREQHGPDTRGNYLGFRCVLGSPSVTPAPAAGLVTAYRGSLVFITGTNGAGSGFLANYGTGTVLFTNAHVAAGVRGAVFKTLEGVEIKTSAASCAVGHDIFLLQAAALGKPLEIMQGVDENASIGDEVVVLGNAEGAGVINTITGKIVGLGPQLVEVDAPFQPGNSGSPIIHLKSGKVIGVATYAIVRKYDAATKERFKQPVIRRFGYRIDSIKSWQAINWPNFSAQAGEMEAIEKLTGDLAAFLRDIASHSRVTRGAHNNPLIKSRIDQWAEDRSKQLSPRDAAMANKSLLSFLKITCQNDVAAARQRLTYDYFQRKLAEQQRERDEISGVLGEIMENVR